MDRFREVMEIVGTAVDGVGVFIVAAGALVATARLVVRRAQEYRQLLFVLSPGHRSGDFVGLRISDCRRHYSNRRRRTDHSKRARPRIDSAHPHVP